MSLSGSRFGGCSLEGRQKKVYTPYHVAFAVCVLPVAEVGLCATREEDEPDRGVDTELETRQDAEQDTELVGLGSYELELFKNQDVPDVTLEAPGQLGQFASRCRVSSSASKN
eukprot:2894591-Rhodomonas_salina.1